MQRRFVILFALALACNDSLPDLSQDSAAIVDASSDGRLAVDTTVDSRSFEDAPGDARHQADASVHDASSTDDARNTMVDGSLADGVVADSGPQTCRGNSACEDGWYCSFEWGCGRAIPGICKKRPSSCIASVNAPVCACNATTYKNACAAAVAGWSVAYPESCNDDDCIRLNNEFLEVLRAAKRCDPNNRASCTGEWSAHPDRGLFCQNCDTHVSSTNTNAIKTMETMKQQWTKGGCSTNSQFCPLCSKNTVGVCQADGSDSRTTSHCVDKVP